MGSNNNAAGEGHKGDDVVFKSKDIVSKTKARQKKEYFVKFKEKTAGQKFSEWFNKHKKKIIIIACIVVAAVVAIFAAIKIIAILNKPQPEEPVDWAEETQQTYEEIEDYVTSSEEADPYADMNEHYKERYESETDPQKKFTILSAWGQYLEDQELWNEAMDVYLLADISSLDNGCLFQLYYGMWRVSVAQGNDADAKIYMDLMEKYGRG